MEKGLWSRRYLLLDLTAMCMSATLKKTWKKAKASKPMHRIRPFSGTKVYGRKGPCMAKENSASRKSLFSKGGDQYTGQFSMGIITGQGSMTFKSHPAFIHYDGNWKDGSFNGTGTLILKHDELYKGEWLSGERNGIGMFQYAKVSPYRTYKGQWKNDECSGTGCLTL